MYQCRFSSSQWQCSLGCLASEPSTEAWFSRRTCQLLRMRNSFSSAFIQRSTSRFGELFGIKKWTCQPPFYEAESGHRGAFPNQKHCSPGCSSDRPASLADHKPGSPTYNPADKHRSHLSSVLAIGVNSQYRRLGPRTG